MHSIVEKSQKKLWKATKTPTIKIHVEVAKSIKTVVENKLRCGKTLFYSYFLYELMAMNDKIIENEKNIIFYNDEDGNAKIEVLLENENVWLTQIALSKLFDTTRNNITLHISNIYKEAELEENSTSKDFLQV